MECFFAALLHKYLYNYDKREVHIILMKKNVLTGFLISVLIICSAVYVRHCKTNDDAIPAMSGQYNTGVQNTHNMTFSDLAETICRKYLMTEGEIR